ncbi:hypothetical protein D2B41_07350 [Salmonella enterica]|nr:hypothetical protein [Salmonella enterica]EBM5988285.1 hypothetical protein [Salmonella enterica]
MGAGAPMTETISKVFHVRVRRLACSPRELTEVSDRGEQATPTQLWRERRRKFRFYRPGLKMEPESLRLLSISPGILRLGERQRTVLL